VQRSSSDGPQQKTEQSSAPGTSTEAEKGVVLRPSPPLLT